MSIAEKIQIAVVDYYNQHKNNPTIIITHPSLKKRLNKEYNRLINPNVTLHLKKEKLHFMGIEMIESGDLECDEIRVY
jgi:Fe-S oxidoreductase